MTRSLAPLQIVVALLLALRLYYHLNADLFGDEAYYYLWSQHLSWSYFDHPPLHAWLIRAITTVLPGVLGIRTLMWLTLAGVLAILWDWSKRIAPADPQTWFWTAAALYLASPLFFGITLVAYHDHLLILLCLAAVHCFAVFSERHEAGATGARRWLFLAAIALGLATLTKYTGMFIGIGFALSFALRPGLRSLLMTPYPWLAALLAVALQAPVLIWNLAEGFASYRFHIDGRWKGHAGHVDWWHPIRFLLMTVVIWSPVLPWPLIRLMRARAAGGFEGAIRTTALAIFGAATVALLAISLVLDAYFYWSLVGLTALMPVLAGYIGRRVALWLHLGFGIVCAALMVVNFSILPLAAFHGGKDPGTGINFGWTEIARHMRAVGLAHPGDLLAASGYPIAAPLSVALGEDVADLSPLPSQYDYWAPRSSFAGQSALVLTGEGESDQAAELKYIRSHFATFAPVETFAVTRYGRVVYTWHIYRGVNWTP
jgi:4-amino-4-deoxy-L-arabinose transferase-like glycosyltransferase